MCQHISSGRCSCQFDIGSVERNFPGLRQWRSRGSTSQGAENGGFPHQVTPAFGNLPIRDSTWVHFQGPSVRPCLHTLGPFCDMCLGDWVKTQGKVCRVAQYQFFLIDSISIILFPFLSIPISISINLKRAYQYQYVINYWKIPLSISISISINLLPYQYRYQYFSTCLKSSYYKSAAAQKVRQRSLEAIAALDKVYTSFLYPTTHLTSTNPYSHPLGWIPCQKSL